jgi:hypothetical protein
MQMREKQNTPNCSLVVCHLAYLTDGSGLGASISLSAAVNGGANLLGALSQVLTVSPCLRKIGRGGSALFNLLVGTKLDRQFSLFCIEIGPRKGFRRRTRGSESRARILKYNAAFRGLQAAPRVRPSH